MDLKTSELSLDEIHKSIERALASIKIKHDAIIDDACNVESLAKFASATCSPISDSVRKHSAASLAAMRQMLSSHESVLRAAITGSPRSESIILLDADESKEESSRNARNTSVCTLPPVVRNHHHHVVSQKQRSLPPTFRYPPITNVSLSPSGSRGSARLTSPVQRKSPPPPPTQNNTDDEEISKRHDVLRRYIDDVERHVRTLQGTFSTYTQRVLVPLQTFCKTLRLSKEQSLKNKQQPKESGHDKSINDLYHTEFAIVQNMNQIRLLLWPSQDGVDVSLFTNNGLSKKVADDVDCARFPVLRLLPDVLTKFDEVTQKSNFWLKRDVLYTQNTKSALFRAHRRFTKTERMWQEARMSHRQLLSEWEHMNAEVHTNSTRLETLEHDIDMMREDLERSHDHRRTLEIKLRANSENLDPLRARHRAIRKRIIKLSTKIEQRERNYEFMESRVRSQRADQDAMQEKIRISEGYAGSLQGKMEEFYNSRAAWKRRYVAKSDPEILQIRLQSVKLRIPIPAVREKTFILKSRLDNLREAFTYIEDGLEDKEVHWTTLCYHLQWPDHIRVTYPNEGKVNPPVAALPKEFTDSDDSSSASSASSTSAGKSRKEWQNAQRVIEYVNRRFPNKTSQQRSFMLRLWLRCNGEQANIEQLIAALRASKLQDVADYVGRLVR